MANDNDWVEEVKRWVATGSRIRNDDAAPDADALGYEAADPALQAREWPDAPGHDALG